MRCPVDRGGDRRGTALAHRELVHDEQLTGVARLRPPERRSRSRHAVRPRRYRPTPVTRPPSRPRSDPRSRRARQAGGHLLALHDHRLEVSADAAGLEPPLPHASKPVGRTGRGGWASIGAPARPRVSAVSPSWTLVCPPYCGAASIWRGLAGRTGQRDGCGEAHDLTVWPEGKASRLSTTASRSGPVTSGSAKISGNGLQLRDTHPVMRPARLAPCTSQA